MKGNNNTYHVTGNDKAGYRIAVPTEAKKTAAYGRVYRCHIKRDGTLIYQPVHP